jgi:glycosyltransferase involved in cell wall biosynthesis
MKKNPLVIINNEKVFKQGGEYYCDNLDMKVLPEGLTAQHDVEFIVRGSKIKGSQSLNLENIKVASNIFKFIYFIINTFKKKRVSYLLITITPYTFVSFLILFLFRKKTYIYLMSSGHEEWKHILGSWSVWIFHIMYLIVSKNSNVIVCHERLFNKEKSYQVYPSRLDSKWFANHKEISTDKIKLLYVGRINPEKGIYDFLNMYDQIKIKTEFSIAGHGKNLKIKNNNVKLLGYISEPQSLIDVYDSHNIMVLPSFTEAHPYVVDECLSRIRPVIIFEDISYIVRDKKGVFVSKRNIESFSETLEYVIKNYYEIQKNIKKNKLPNKQDMLDKFSKILTY